VNSVSRTAVAWAAGGRAWGLQVAAVLAASAAAAAALHGLLGG
jgi:hypothetical protein